MRELRQDEKDLINRVRKRDDPMVTAAKKLTLATKRMGRALTVDEVSTDPSDSLPHRFPGLLEINDHPILHPEKILNEPVHRRPIVMDKNGGADRDFTKGDSVVREPSQTLTVPVEEFPQEDTLDQIERMIDDLPDDDICKSHGHKCPWMGGLVISSWARGFLRQLVREHKGRVK